MQKSEWQKLLICDNGQIMERSQDVATYSSGQKHLHSDHTLVLTKQIQIICPTNTVTGCTKKV